MYYTRDAFVKNSTETGPNITTGYIDRQVYKENPLTHKDLKKYLDDTSRKQLSPTEKNIRNQQMDISEIYFDRIYHLIRQTFIAFVGKISKSENTRKFKDNVTFQLFGVDVGVSDKLNPMIIEVNKGPDMSAKDDRDAALKQGVINGLLKLVGAVKYNKCNETGFVHVLEVENGKVGSTAKEKCSI